MKPLFLHNVLSFLGLRSEVDWLALAGSPRKTGASRPVLPTQEADGGIAHEVDPDFLEHVRREAFQQPAGRTALGGLNQTKIFLENSLYFWP